MKDLEVVFSWRASVTQVSHQRCPTNKVHAVLVIMVMMRMITMVVDLTIDYCNSQTRALVVIQQGQHVYEGVLRLNVKIIPR